jgi:pilin isopeptide linkage protein
MMTYHVTSFGEIKSLIEKSTSDLTLIFGHSMEATTVQSPITVEGKTITLTATEGDLYSIVRYGTCTDYFFRVESDANLIINNITLDGNKAKLGDRMNSALIYNEGYLELQGETTLKNNIGGGVDTTYQNLKNLHVGADVVFSGNEAEHAYKRNPADDALYSVNIHGTTWTEPFTQGYNNYDIAYTNGQLITLGGGGDEGGGEDGNKDDANVRFPDICFNEEGVYEFTVRETSVSGDGWVTDPREYPVIVTVTDDGHGKLKAHVEYPEGEPKFVNKYEPKSVCVKLIAFKTAIGAPLKDGMFEFGVFDEDGKKIASAKNRKQEDNK